jgi:hypothetical protein
MQTYCSIILNVYVVYYILIIFKSCCELPEDGVTDIKAQRNDTRLKFKQI